MPFNGSNWRLMGLNIFIVTAFTGFCYSGNGIIRCEYVPLFSTASDFL